MARLIGLRTVDYKAQSGRQVNGVNLYLTEVRNDVVGEGCFDCFLSERAFGESFGDVRDLSVLVGRSVEVRYNRFGRVEKILMED